jgi:ribosomal protein L37AE/L43A
MLDKQVERLTRTWHVGNANIVEVKTSMMDEALFGKEVVDFMCGALPIYLLRNISTRYSPALSNASAPSMPRRKTSSLRFTVIPGLCQCQHFTIKNRSDQGFWTCKACTHHLRSEEAVGPQAPPPSPQCQATHRNGELRIQFGQ